MNIHVQYNEEIARGDDYLNHRKILCNVNSVHKKDSCLRSCYDKSSERLC